MPNRSSSADFIYQRGEEKSRFLGEDCENAKEQSDREDAKWELNTRSGQEEVTDGSSAALPEPAHTFDEQSTKKSRNDAAGSSTDARG